MERYKIAWTKRAVRDLKKVYLFYTISIGEERAFQLISKIVQRVEILTDARFHKMGAIDEDFNHLKRDYRKLIEGNIKITYRINNSLRIIYINRLFDTRQHPGKNK